MKKSRILSGFICIMICSSILGGVTATNYVGLAVDDIFVWELNNGDFLQYFEYEITDIAEEMGNITATASLSVYDVYIGFVAYAESRAESQAEARQVVEHLGNKTAAL